MFQSSRKLAYILHSKAIRDISFSQSGVTVSQSVTVSKVFQAVSCYSQSGVSVVTVRQVFQPVYNMIQYDP